MRLLNNISSIIILAIFILSGHSVVAEEPSPKQLQNAFSFEIPGEWRVEDFTVEVSQNVGSAVEPLIKSRFRSTVKLTADTFIPVANIQGAVILSPQLKRDETRTIYGISSAVLNQGAWKISFEVQGQPFANAGKPRGAYPGRTLIGGSDEHRAYAEELEAERRKKIEQQNAARRAAEEKRLAKEKAYQERSEAHFGSVETIFTSGTILAGTWSEPGYSRRQVTPFQVSFTNYSPTDGAFKGQAAWQSGAILTIEGFVKERTIRFSETGWINNPKGKGNNFMGGEGKILNNRIVGVMCINTEFDKACRKGNAEWVLTLPRDVQ